jgi:general secretion pathway protein E
MELIPAASLPPVKTPSWRELARFSSKAALLRIPRELALKARVLPVAEIGGEMLTLLCERLPTLEEARELRFASGCELVLEEVECRGEFSLAIESAYQSLTEITPVVRPIERESLGDELSEGSVAAALRYLLERAYAENASDIHLDCQRERLQLRLRVDGELREIASDQLSTLGELLPRRIKVLARIDLMQVGRPTEGAFTFNFGSTHSVSVRVSSLPTVDGEKVVLRLHAPPSEEEERELSSLDLPERLYEELLHALNQDSGAILLSGPTGSGKTTLLYNALSYLYSPERNLVSLEDPVERKVFGVSQTSIDLAKGLDYANLLKFVLRQDPDVIMIGEIRDEDTAKTALTASLTGHLVLSTVHASNIFDIITRLRQFVADRDLLAKAPSLLLSQRLIPRVCPHCSERKAISPELARFFGIPVDSALAQASGCLSCSHTGNLGRIAVYEWLTVNNHFRKLLAEAAPESELIEAARAIGYLPYRYDLREKLLSGKISAQSALRALGVVRRGRMGQDLS